MRTNSQRPSLRLPMDSIARKPVVVSTPVTPPVDINTYENRLIEPQEELRTPLEPANRLACAVCEWAVDGASASECVEATSTAYQHHFLSVAHLRNYFSWCRYRDENSLTNDYVDEWLAQLGLAETHSSIIEDVQPFFDSFESPNAEFFTDVEPSR